MKARTVARAGSNLTAYLVTLIFLIPVYILVNLSIRPAGDLTPGIIPSSHPTLDNFITAWTTSSLPSAIITSAVVTSISCILILVLATTAAYPLARSTSRLSNGTFYVFLIGLLLPFQLAMLPLYFQMRDLGLLGSIWSLVIIYAGTQLPFSIFLITTFLRTSVPLEYEEAARIDGCGNVATFWHVVVPLLRPVLGTCLILIGVGIWNDFFTPLIYLSGSHQVTIPMSIYQYVGQYVSNWPLIFASLIISMLPILVIYLVFQRYVIHGFAGGLKG
ncbi:carbohydrate ABC transporter permease [Microbacterium sp. B2969]|uniref:Carbohydrate ABC transporter permease n=1 Tax=Microbacterium alkaliflavum TaxID=3248839 RepID=A0ABW7Q2G5_9MICO